MRLSKSSASVEVDVAAMRLSEFNENSARDNEMLAQNWLNVGASKPEAERERLRWAKFTLDAVEELASEEAHGGQRRKNKPQVATDGDAAPPDSAEETRVLSALGVGRLELNDRRVTHRLPVAVEFVYAVAATPGALPEKIVVKSRRSMPVPLRSHDISPRDAAGQPQPSELGLIGTVIGRTASLSFELSFVPAPE
jgi:hypothetical protein